MADIKDILGVPRSVAGNDGPAPKPVKEKMQRPQGMSREAFALLGGSHPIMPSHLASELRKKSEMQVRRRSQHSSRLCCEWRFPLCP
jgi:DNA methyltransferase 1-associated protein 1